MTQFILQSQRKSIKDAQPIIQLLKKGSLSIIEGALMPLAYDKMLPPNNEIIELIELGFDLNKHSDRIGKERGYTDPRYSLAAACAGWDKRLTLEFLNHCLATANNDHMLEQVALNSLKQKYSNLR
ncbi:hypothetical protein DU508_23675 [Pedobacter chinensis]|uniref:Uncharacterized protein n=1 Tax=Pedobacter chinensis TaxID=2282421 RepID=A0A369PND6_9SPHI|nr:hypothetical protein [Pedobacter chinensis]RDC54054.1 hypothetical protein DU508_23675 [Pedobacter chinensis]